MKDKHLSDAEIQQYVLQKKCDAYTLEHMRHCTNCKIKAVQYRLILDGIKAQEKPVFEFSLAELVIEQLPEHQQKKPNGRAFSYYISFMAIFFALIIFYLFGSNLISLFKGITPISIGLIITTVTGLLVILCIDMYKKYRMKIQILNFD